MNQGRIWCVVNPTVGLPLFLGSVAVTSLIVHYAVLSNTSWMAGFFNGKAKPKSASIETVPQPMAAEIVNGIPGFTVSVSPTLTNGQTSFVINVSPKSSASAPIDTAAVDTQSRAAEPLALVKPNQ